LPNKVDLKMIRRHIQAPYGSRTTTPPPDPPFFLEQLNLSNILQLSSDRIIVH